MTQDAENLRQFLESALKNQTDALVLQAKATESLAEEKARLAQAEEEVLAYLQKISIAELRRAAAVEQLLGEVGDLTVYLRRELALELGRISTLILQLLVQQPLSEAVNENADIQAAKIERIFRVQRLNFEYSRLLLSLLASTLFSDRKEAIDQFSLIIKRLKSELETQELDENVLPSQKQVSTKDKIKHLQEQLIIYQRNLQNLQTQVAKHGAYPPLHLSNEIVEIETQITIIESKLDAEQGK